MENIIVLRLRMSISIITNIFIQVVQFLNENFCENLCRIQSVGLHLVLRLQTTDRSQFNNTFVCSIDEQNTFANERPTCKM